MQPNLGRGDKRVYCCLYKYLSKNDKKALTIRFTDLGVQEQEKLRFHLVQKIEEGKISGEGSIDEISSIRSEELDPTSPTTIPNPSCYHKNLGPESNQHLLCLVAAVQTDGLSLFLPDLQRFAESVEEILEQEFANEEDRDLKLQEYLPSWYWISIDYVVRAVLLFGKELPVLLHASLIGKHIITKPHKHAEDVSRFVECVRFSFAGNDDLETPPATVVVTLSNADGEPLLNTSETNDFCREWADLLTAEHSLDAIQFKKKINDKKHKVANELVVLEKLISDAKVDNYCLYQTYVTLVKNKNADVLLGLLLHEWKGKIDPESKGVILLLDGFLKETAKK